MIVDNSDRKSNNRSVEDYDDMIMTEWTTIVKKRWNKEHMYCFNSRVQFYKDPICPLLIESIWNRRVGHFTLRSCIRLLMRSHARSLARSFLVVSFDRSFAAELMESWERCNCLWIRVVYVDIIPFFFISVSLPVSVLALASPHLRFMQDISRQSVVCPSALVIWFVRGNIHVVFKI